MKKDMQEVLNEEGVVRNEPAQWIKSDEQTEHGRLILTTKRLFFTRASTENIAFNRDVSDEPILAPIIEIDLDTINALSRETYVVDENVLAITYLQYETVKFSVIHYDEWEKEIQSTRMTPDIPGDPNKEEAA